MKFLILLLVILTAGVLSNAATPVKLDPNLFVFSATTPHFVPAATATDLCIINGSATKKVKVISFEVASNQTTAGANNYVFLKRSTANTGGTAITPASVRWNSGGPAATAVFQYYTANPTPGTLIASTMVKRFLSAISTSLFLPSFDALNVTYNGNSLPIVLNGVAEGFALNFDGRAVPAGMSIGCTVRWIEE